MNNTQLLLINDMCGYGKVALSAMLPVLSHMGYRIHNLPTALVSDTLNYPKFYIHDTTEYVRQSLAIWEELGFEFDAISTGFIVTEEGLLAKRVADEALVTRLALVRERGRRLSPAGERFLACFSSWSEE